MINTKFYIVMGLILLTTLIMTITSFQNGYNYSTEWSTRPSVIGTLTDVRYSHGGSTKGRSYSIDVTYDYLVDGEIYTGHKLGGIKSPFISNKKTVSQTLQKYNLIKDSEVEVFYNPLSPQESVLFYEAYNYYRGGFISLLLFLPSILIIVLALKNKKKTKS